MTIPEDEFVLQGAIVEKLRHVFDDPQVEIISETDRIGRPLIIVKVGVRVDRQQRRYEVRIYTDEHPLPFFMEDPV